MIKKLSSLSVLLLLFSGLTHAHYRPGFVVNNSGDTLRGEVKYRETKNSYHTCEFRKNGSREVITYTPDQISSYGFNGDRAYETKEISIAEGKKEKVFLQVLIRGVITLYENRSAFWVEKSGVLQELKNTSETTFINERSMLRENREYMGVLRMLTFDCKENQYPLEKVKLIERSLFDFIKSYNECKGDDIIVFKEKKPWAKVIIGVTGGINRSEVSFSTEYSGSEHLLGKISSSTAPIGGLAFDIQTPRISEHFSFTTAVLYSASNYYRYWVEQKSLTSAIDYRINYLSIHVNQVKVPFGVKFRFQERKLTPFINAGASFAYHTSNSSSWQQEIESYGVYSTSSQEAFEGKKNQAGVWGGIGTSLVINQRLAASIEFRYEQTNGISPHYVDTGALRSTVKNMQVLFVLKTR